MEAPLLFALAHARLNIGGGAVQGVWASQRALALNWAPDRAAGIGPSMAWIFLLNPAQELWLLHEKHEAYLALKSESKTDLSRLWSQELKGARLCDVSGDPRERWLALEFRKRAITGRIEGIQLSFQAIPGRGGLRLDGLDLNPARAGMGVPFSSKQPDCEPDTPPLRKWREKWGDSLEDALNGQIAEVLPGEGTLFQRHIEWSIQRAEKLLLQPKALAANRKIIKERQRLERYGKALAEDLVRHRAAIGLREPAGKLNAELWRLKGACGSTELLDGTIIEIPPSMSAEGAVQKWFGQAKKAERGLARVEALERERTRQIIGLELPCGENDGSAAPHILLAENPKAARQSRPKEKLGHGKKKMTDEKTHKRNDGKGRAFRSQIVEGFEVLIGKGDADNDNLTFKVASPSDFWLHVAAVPGSHVIIRNPDKISEPPRDVLERAAGLAAFYSKARDGGKVEVHWCRVADVNKPRGFEPGKVFLKNHKSLKVYPKQ